MNSKDQNHSFNIVIYILNSCDETQRASGATKIKPEKERLGKMMHELVGKDETRNIYEKSLDQVKKTVLDIMRGEDIQIILFGSRARGDFNRFSDIDIGILPRNECNKKKLTILKEKLEDMNIPYKVEVVDISKVSQIFREKALKEGKLWKS